MKVVHLIASSGMYGAEKWILALIRAMNDSYIESILVNLSDSASDISAVVVGAHERGLDAQDFHTGGTFNPLSIVRFSRWLKKNQIDIVHGHGYKSDVLGFFSAKLAGCKIITTPHGWTKNADWKLQIYEKIDRFMLRFMDCVCPLSEELMESVRSFVSSDKLHLILNGVDIDEIGTFNPAFDKKENEFVIGYIGRLVPGKSLHTLLHAVKLLCDSFEPDTALKIRIIIVGDGDSADELKQLVHDLDLNMNVEFLGFRSDAISFLKCFDLFVLPSLSEGISRSLMEAMSALVLVIASDICGNRFLVQDSETGFLFPPEDSTSLFLILKKVIENREPCYNISRCARLMIERKFSSKIMAEEYQSVYLQVRARNNKRR